MFNQYNVLIKCEWTKLNSFKSLSYNAFISRCKTYKGIAIWLKGISIWEIICIITDWWNIK